MNIFSLSGLLLGATCFGLAIFVFSVGREKIHKLWGLFNVSIGIWGMGIFFAGLAKDQQSAEFWWKIAHVGGVFAPVFLLHTVFLLCNIKRRWELLLWYFQATLFQVLSIIGFTGTGMQYAFNSFYYPTPDFYCIKPIGLYYPIFVPIFFFILLRGFYLLCKLYRNSAGKTKQRIGWFLFGELLGWGGGGLYFLPVFGIYLYPYGNFTIPIYTIVVTYAIFRHNLLDIEVIIKKTLVFAGLFIASYAVFSSFAYLGSMIFENVVQNRWIALIPSVFIIVLILRPLETFLRNATDKYLFQKAYDYRRLLRTFADEVLTVLDLDILLNLTVNKLVEIIKLKNASIFLFDDETDTSRIVASAGTENLNQLLKNKDELVAHMRKRGEYIVREDLDYKKQIDSGIKDKTNEMQAVLVIPLMHHKDMVGILALGKKKSDEEFTQDDIDILFPLARTLSIAITNAQLFEKLSEAQAQAAQREKMAVIGTLSAGINHEICNPLGIARGQCEMFLLNLQEGIYQDKSSNELLDKAQEIMQKVINETDRATVITRKLSSFAKPAKGEIKDDVNVEEEINKVVSLVEHDLKLDDIIVEKYIQKDMPHVAADSKQIQEIFFNIIRNAAQSIDGEGKVIIRALSDNKKVYIDIEDTGIGINKKNLDRIFNPFFTTKEPGKGTGLGLFIVKQIVERNNGSISVNSEPENGTIFSLAFQIAGAMKAEKIEEVSGVDGEGIE